ncbi:MAG: globin domain-containing protein, partial [Brevibacterium aurantiacum]
MISQSALSVIRETLPVVGASIGEITPIFYSRMFAARPDLERDLFNRGNQAQGEQQKALAGAIAAYATLLVSDDAPNIDAMMSRISNKHASLGITEDQYAIVYEHLFAAIAEVLGDAATSDVVDAWTAVYWDMADSLIRAEKGLYARFQVDPGDVWRELVVVARTQQSPTTVSLELAREDGAALPEAQPGQYLS